ncbi:MAG: hypothetical protein JWM11_1596 [Planctomycetaceae bacterium]|nr:hypothetical protein [Planctomycetaceae bacterium]
MIRVYKSATAPKRLHGITSPGGKATQKLCLDHEAGVTTFTFKSNLYGDATVKNQLRLDQHEKCVFCESKFGANYHGDVEHIRPKGGFTQHEDDKLTTPGYFWLAYEWSNLTFCCALCNQTHKKNHFPLANPKRRARSHKDDVTQEKPILINPVEEDPQQFIDFNQEVARGIDTQERGRRTIDLLGLNRPLVQEKRREYLTQISLLWDSYHIIKQNLDFLDAKDLGKFNTLRDFLFAARKPQAEYSSMVTSFLQSVGGLQ